MTAKSVNRRTGIALLWALVVLSVLGVTSAVATREFALARRSLAMRLNRIQAEWLARSGVELAVARLLADDSYTGESVEPIPGGGLKITVEKDTSGSYRIRSDATFPTGDYRTVTFTVTRTAKRRTDGGKVPVDLVAGPDAPPGP